MDLVEGLLLVAIVGGLADGMIAMVRHEIARRRAERMVLPPMRTIEVRDELPF